MTRDEYRDIVAFLREVDPALRAAVLNQDKVLQWFEDITYTACLFLDTRARLCMIYPVRPLVCRMFGSARHLPCPLGKKPATYNPRYVLESYTRLPRRTFQQWMMLDTTFDFAKLLGPDAARGRTFEL